MPNSHALKPGDHLYLIDGSGYIFRAYHALPPLTRKSDGLPVGAVQGFCNMLWKLLKETSAGDKPTHLAVVYDHSAKTFRNRIYPAYKAHRPEPPADLRPQFGLIRQATRAFNVACVEQEDYEADDLIATYARQASEAGATCRIVSSDKDLMQLVRPGVALLDTMKDKVIGESEVLAKFGVSPGRVVDVQALSGDSIDNVPGVPGIGEKSAGPIIAELGSLDPLIADAANSVAIRASLMQRLDVILAELAEIAGEPVKLGSGSQLAQILVGKCGLSVTKLDKKGIATADTAMVEEFAFKGDSFCKNVLRARTIQKLLASQLDQIVREIDKVRISRQLVMLDDRVPVIHAVDSFAVEQPKASHLVGFLKTLEFVTFTRKVAGELNAEAAEIEALPVTIEYWPPEDGVITAPDASSRQKPGRTDQTDESESVKVPSQGAMGPGFRREDGEREKALLALPFTYTDYDTVTSLETLDRWIAMAYETGRVAFDTETDSLDGMQSGLVGVSLATAPGKACYIPLAHKSEGGGLFGGEAVAGQIKLADAIARLKPLFEDASVLKIGQNCKYDMQVLARHGIEASPIDDTMLISYVLEAGDVGHGMDELSERHLAHKCISFKEVAGSGRSLISFGEVPLERATPYAAEDADVTFRLWQLLKPRLQAMAKLTVYETLERPLSPVLGNMERAGILVDSALLKKLSNEFAAAAAVMEKQVYEMTGERFNIASPKQLGDILYGRMGLGGGRKTATGAWSTDSGALEELAAQGIELARRVLDWRQLAKLRSTYTDALPTYINPATGRVHTCYSMAATSTGRLSSTEPNLQNIPVRTEEGRKIRTAFIAPPGAKLISADYSQIELRVLAHVADIPQLKKAFAEGIDIHAMTASEMFGVAVTGMDPQVRRRAKAINFGIIYGISAFGLANQLSISREEAGDYIRTYFTRFPGIRDYIDSTKKLAREQGFVETVFGRRLHFPRIKSPNPSERAFLERAAINAPIQGAAADVIRRAMVRMPEALAAAGLSAKMLLQVHDELVFEAPEAECEATMLVVKRIMEKAPEPAVLLSVPLQVDARAADNWEAAH